MDHFVSSSDSDAIAKGSYREPCKKQPTISQRPRYNSAKTSLELTLVVMKKMWVGLTAYSILTASSLLFVLWNLMPIINSCVPVLYFLMLVIVKS